MSAFHGNSCGWLIKLEKTLQASRLAPNRADRRIRSQLSSTSFEHVGRSCRLIKSVDHVRTRRSSMSVEHVRRSKLFVVLLRLFDPLEAVLVLLDHIRHEIADELVPLAELLLPLLHGVPVLAGQIIVVVPFIWRGRESLELGIEFEVRNFEFGIKIGVWI